MNKRYRQRKDDNIRENINYADAGVCDCKIPATPCFVDLIPVVTEWSANEKGDEDGL
jgi:hypothetical protein